MCFYCLTVIKWSQSNLTWSQFNVVYCDVAKAKFEENPELWFCSYKYNNYDFLFCSFEYTFMSRTRIFNEKQSFQFKLRPNCVDSFIIESNSWEGISSSTLFLKIQKFSHISCIIYLWIIRSKKLHASLEVRPKLHRKACFCKIKFQKRSYNSLSHHITVVLLHAKNNWYTQNVATNEAFAP